MRLSEIIERLRSPHADKIYVAKEYTKAELIRDLEDIDAKIEEDREWTEWRYGRNAS